MKKILLATAILASTCACQSDSDGSLCTGRVSWSAGSMEPPYTYNWRLEFGEETTFTFDSDKRDDDVLYSAMLEPTEEQISTLCASLDIPSTEPPGVGGEVFRWETDTSEGYVTDDSMYAPIDAAQEIIGDHYSSALDAYDEWKETQFSTRMWGPTAPTFPIVFFTPRRTA